jgi:predicted proteasome-type protease
VESPQGKGIMSKIYTTELVLTPAEKNILISILSKYESTASVLQVKVLEETIVESLLTELKSSLVEHDQDKWRKKITDRVIIH